MEEARRLAAVDASIKRQKCSLFKEKKQEPSDDESQKDETDSFKTDMSEDESF